MMSNNKPFIWAQGQEANVKEPIDALKESGWRYGDVPTASNFNWLFKTITEQATELNKNLLQHEEESKNALAKQEREQDGKRRLLESELNEKLTRMKESQNAKTKQLALSLETTWDLLRNLEDMIRQYHPNLPKFTWPSKVWPRNDANDTTTTDLDA
jgi:hypothetical protein